MTSGLKFAGAFESLSFSPIPHPISIYMALLSHQDFLTTVQCDDKKNCRSYFSGKESQPSAVFLKQPTEPDCVDLGTLTSLLTISTPEPQHILHITYLIDSVMKKFKHFIFIKHI